MADDDRKRAAAGRNFSRAMDRAGVRQSDVMSLTGASASQVSNWSKRGVSAQFATAVAEYLKVKPHQISLVRESYASDEVAVLGDDPAQYTRTRPGPSVSEPKPLDPGKQALIEALEEARLSRSDLALIELLVARLSGG